MGFWMGGAAGEKAPPLQGGGGRSWHDPDAASKQELLAKVLQEDEEIIALFAVTSRTSIIDKDE